MDYLIYFGHENDIWGQLERNQRLYAYEAATQTRNGNKMTLADKNRKKKKEEAELISVPFKICFFYRMYSGSRTFGW